MLLKNKSKDMLYLCTAIEKNKDEVERAWCMKDNFVAPSINKLYPSLLPTADVEGTPLI
jgi:hypothetical protein